MHLLTDDALDGLTGVIAEVLTTKPAKDELTYCVEYTTPSGATENTFFRANEVMVERDQTATNHGAF